MKLYVLLGLLLACAAINAQRVDPTVLRMGATRKISVRLAYNINMVNVTNTPLCLPNNTNAAACTPTLASSENVYDSDQVIINWALNASFPDAGANATGIQFRACYTNASTVGRAWRFDKFAQLPSLSRQCKFVINTNPVPLGSGNGTYVWYLPNNLPEAQYFIRAYTVCGKNEDGKNLYCAWGESVGQRFAVQSWEAVPTWLLATTIPCMCVGPIILAAYTVYKFAFAKKNQ